MKKEENFLIRIIGVQGLQKGIQKVNSYTTVPYDTDLGEIGAI